MPSDTRPTIRIGHSPDPDDAFMWWPLVEVNGQPARIPTGRFRFQHILSDIETLNQRTAKRDLEVTALSCAQYPFVKDHYVLTACGCSMGDQYGPRIVSRQPLTLNDLKRPDMVMAVPGERTSAFAATTLMLGKGAFRYVVVPFDRIIERVAAGEFDSGLIIHEGQLTFQDAGLNLIRDLGEWWWETHKLPLPLGVNAIRRDLDALLGPGSLDEIAGILRQSVEYALAHRPQAIAYALGFARGMDARLADEFIGMYVNKWTLDFGPAGRKAVRTFLDETHRAGLTPACDGIDFVGAGAPHPINT
ncbi:MAG: ABC transporter substrate-binding protein [Phycisphaerales bacterium]|nr:ABC transporter substrate-binding protein [Phycisphaerales bacterium]